MVELASTIWADGPSSDPYEPDKAQIREWGTWVEGALATVATYGGSSLVDSSAAISAMATALGFVRFGKGSTLISADLTITVPIYFEPGAYVTVAATKTLTINNSISSSRQWIFRGEGSYSLGHNHTTDAGEDAREVHASWFGAFPNPDPGPDQAPFISKAFASMGNGRESIIHFDIGNYNLSSQVTVTRGGQVKGSGTRRTVFKVDNDGYDVFVTSNVACKFTDFGFELHSGISTRENAWIRILHGECEIYNLSLGHTRYGITIAANNCRVFNLFGGFGVTPTSGSSVVRIESGSGNRIDGILFGTSSSVGPEYIVHVVGVNASTTASGTTIENIFTLMPSILVGVEASSRSVGTGSIRNVRSGAFAGPNPRALVEFKTSNTFDIVGWTLSDVIGTSHPTNGITFANGSSGSIRRISISNCILENTTGYGIGFLATAGSISSITVDDSVRIANTTTPFSYSGSVSSVKVAAGAIPNAMPAQCYDFTIADDSVAQITLGRGVVTGWLMISVGSSQRGIYTIRAASTPSSSAYGTPTANLATSTSVLTGTTGTDGNFTIGVTDGVLYFENRLGSSQRVNVSLLTVI